MRPGVLQTTKDFFSQQLSGLSAYLSRQPLVPTVFLIACAVALVALALFLLGARRGMERQWRLHECRRHFDDDDDDDDQGLPVCEKVLGPSRSQGSPPETRREFGLKTAGGHAQGASLKPDLPPFHVSGQLS